jgi:hypothetical protein
MDKRIKEFFGNQPVMFIKFSDNIDNLKSLQQGNLYMNNLKFFVDLEEKTGISGMGDKLETLNVINDVELSFYIPGTEQLVAKTKARKANLRYEDALYKPVFCLFAVTADMLEIYEESETEVKLKINFTNEQINKMRSEFGTHALVISPPHFSEQLEKSFNQNGYDYSGRFVEYIDTNINQQRRLEAFANQDISLFFFKDHGFKHQNEFRIVILNKDEEKAIIENIGSLTKGSILLKTEDLINCDLPVLNIKFKE